MRLYVKTHQGYHFEKKFFSIIPMAAIRYSSDPAGSDLYTTCKRNKTFGKVSA